MQRITAILGLLAAMLAATAADVTLAWDANDPAEAVTEYRLYELGPTTNLVATIPPPESTVTLSGVAPGVHVYHLTAANLWGESAPGNTASTPPSATPPNSLRITVVVTIEQ